MFYKPVAILFRNKAGGVETACMFAGCLLIRPEYPCDALKRGIPLFCDEEEYLNSAVACHAFEVPLHLPSTL